MDRRAFTITETLLGLFFVSLITILISTILNGLYRVDKQQQRVSQALIAKEQLELEFALSSGFFSKDNQLCYHKFEQEYCLFVDEKKRLVRRDGYEIVLFNVNYFDFTIFDKGLELTIESDHETIKIRQ